MDGSYRKKCYYFGADISSPMDVNSKGKDVLILGEGPTQGLDDTTLTAEAKYLINFTQSEKRFVLSLHYNGSNSVLFVNAITLHQFKAKQKKKQKKGNRRLCTVFR